VDVAITSTLQEYGRKLDSLLTDKVRGFTDTQEEDEYDQDSCEKWNALDALSVRELLAARTDSMDRYARYVFELYQWSEQLIYYLRRYEDNFLTSTRRYLRHQQYSRHVLHAFTNSELFAKVILCGKSAC
jgi:hypothetical protein